MRRPATCQPQMPARGLLCLAGLIALVAPRLLDPIEVVDHVRRVALVVYRLPPDCGTELDRGVDTVISTLLELQPARAIPLVVFCPRETAEGANRAEMEDCLWATFANSPATLVGHILMLLLAFGVQRPERR